jgi:hypothetical protein
MTLITSAVNTDILSTPTMEERTAVYMGVTVSTLSAARMVQRIRTKNFLKCVNPYKRPRKKTTPPATRPHRFCTHIKQILMENLTTRLRLYSTTTAIAVAGSFADHTTLLRGGVAAMLVMITAFLVGILHKPDQSRAMKLHQRRTTRRLTRDQIKHQQYTPLRKWRKRQTTPLSQPPTATMFSSSQLSRHEAQHQPTHPRR